MLLPLAFLISEIEVFVCYTCKNPLTFILRKLSTPNVRLHLMSFSSVVGNNSHGLKSTLQNRKCFCVFAK